MTNSNNMNETLTTKSPKIKQNQAKSSASKTLAQSKQAESSKIKHILLVHCLILLDHDWENQAKSSTVQAACTSNVQAKSSTHLLDFAWSLLDFACTSSFIEEVQATIKQNQAACKQLVQAMIKQNQAHTVFAPQFDPQIPYSVNKLLIDFTGSHWVQWCTLLGHIAPITLIRPSGPQSTWKLIG